jgi:hypothetical protein
MGTSLDEFFKEHLPYEIGMMRDSIHALAIRDGLGEFEKNAFIETFCLHARNLIEFFKQKDPCDFDPRDFTHGFELNKRFIGDRALPKINRQVSHLTKGRTKDTARKITGDELTKMHQAIEAEIKRFAQHLKPEWREKWKVGPLLTFQWPEGKAMTTTSLTTIYPHNNTHSQLSSSSQHRLRRRDVAAHRRVRRWSTGAEDVRDLRGGKLVEEAAAQGRRNFEDRRRAVKGSYIDAVLSKC